MRVKLNEYGRGAFIRFIREWTGLTQKEFAKVLGRSVRQVQGYEAGTTSYNIKTLEKIANEFGIVILAEKDK